MIDQLELTRQLRLDFPDGVKKGDSVICMTREFVERVLARIEAAHKNAGIEIILALQRDEAQVNIERFVTYVEPITQSVPMEVLPNLVRIGNEEVWAAQTNAATELFWLLLPHIENTIERAQAAE